MIAYRQAVAPAHAPKPAFEQVGVASWYGPGFHGRETANGEVYNQNAITAAHRSLPLGTRAQVTNLENGKSIEVRINDRGPYVGKRVIDLSRAAAGRLGMVDEGTVSVKIEADAAPNTKTDGSEVKGRGPSARLMTPSARMRSGKSYNGSHNSYGCKASASLHRRVIRVVMSL
ncbi:MAG: septal ring lytic transglycosylase RlpA family protein [Gammaproteobacteria bacterium]